MKNWNLKKILLLASILYLGIAPFTYHPDAKTTLYHGSFVKEKVFNIYGHLARTNDQFTRFHYPPLAYFLHQGEYLLVRPLAGSGLDLWLRSGSEEAVGQKGALRFNFLSKLPAVLALLASGVIIFKIINESLGKGMKKALTATAFWLLNPIALYAVVVMGQFDIFPLLFVLLALYLLEKKPRLALFWAGVGTAIKTFPLLWLPFLALASAQKTRERLKNFGVGIFPYLLCNLLFIRSKEFLKESLFSGLSGRLFAARIEVGFGEAVLMVPVLVGLLFILALKHSTRKKLGFKALLLNLATVSLLVVFLSHAHPQWFLWPIPFLTLLFFGQEEKNLTLVLGLALVFVFISFGGNILLMNDKFLTWGLISSLNREIFNLPTIPEFLRLRGIDFSWIKNLFLSLGTLAALSLALETRGKNAKKES